MDTLRLGGKEFAMPRSHAAYPEVFRRRMVELVRSGRNPEDLARAFGADGAVDTELGLPDGSE